MSDLRSEVFEALGTASMCWSETPTGVFDSDRACNVGDDLMRKIEQVLAAELARRDELLSAAWNEGYAARVAYEKETGEYRDNPYKSPTTGTNQEERPNP